MAAETGESVPGQTAHSSAVDFSPIPEPPCQIVELQRPLGRRLGDDDGLSQIVVVGPPVARLDRLHAIGI